MLMLMIWVLPALQILPTVRRGLAACSVVVPVICPSRILLAMIGFLQQVWWKVIQKCVFPAVIS